jgi:signal transduction histidine kinase
MTNLDVKASSVGPVVSRIRLPRVLRVEDFTAQRPAQCEKQTEAVRQEERTRIAQELHDTLLQTFQSASLHLGAVVLRVAQDSPVKDQLDRILEIMVQGIAEGRDAIHGLRSANKNLIDALSQTPAPADTEFHISVTGTQTQFPPHVEHEIYRIAREALTNAFHHAKAKRIELEAQYSRTALCIRIRDNGCGIAPHLRANDLDRHWGLKNMRDRAAKINAHLTITSHTTIGTTVELRIPTARNALGASCAS